MHAIKNITKYLFIMLNQHLVLCELKILPALVSFSYVNMVIILLSRVHFMQFCPSMWQQVNEEEEGSEMSWCG